MRHHIARVDSLMFSLMFTIACCFTVVLGLGLNLMSGWLVVMHMYFCTTFSCHCHTPELNRPRVDHSAN